MPSYTFKNVNSGETADHVLSMSEYDQFVKDHPELIREYTSMRIGDPVHLGKVKTADWFNTKLKVINEKYQGNMITR